MPTTNQRVSVLATVSKAASQPALLQRKCACGSSPRIAGSCEGCGRSQLKLQRTANRAEWFEAPPIVDEVLRSSGQPLDANARGFFEPRFGHDFSTVRIHADSKAAQSAAAVNALAYTVGQHIVFAGGQYAPASVGGRHLFAHELAHVVQDPSSTQLHRQSPDNIATDPTEVEAESEANRVLADDVEPDDDSESEEKSPDVSQTNRGGLIDEFRSYWGEEIANLKRGFKDHKYGCWCGPGNDCEADAGNHPECVCCERNDYSCCEEAQDDLDQCCCVHDKDFPEDKVYSVTPGDNKVSMWSPEGFDLTLEGDERLLNCLQGVVRYRHPSAGVLYRAFGLGFFTTRVAIGRWLKLRSRIKSGFKAIGRGVVSGAKAVWRGLKRTGRAIAKGVTAVGSAIGHAADWVADEVKSLAAALGRTTVAVFDALVSAARTTGKTIVAVWQAIRSAAEAVGSTVLNFLSCLIEGGRGLLTAIFTGPYKICRFPTKEQTWLIPLGAVVGSLLGQPLLGAAGGALLPLLFHCFRELPGLKSLIGWAPVEKEGSEQKTLTGRLIKDPCIAADDGDINLEIAPCVGSEDLFTAKPGSKAEKGSKEVECETPYGLFLDNFTVRPITGDYIEISGKWVKDLGHDEKGELHPFDSLKIVPACDVAERISK